jgi:hypothetical protein
VEYGLDDGPLQVFLLLRGQIVKSVGVCTKSQMEWYALEEADRISTGTFLSRIKVKNSCFPGIFEMLLKDFLVALYPNSHRLGFNF